MGWASVCGNHGLIGASSELDEAFTIINQERIAGCPKTWVQTMDNFLDATVASDYAMWKIEEERKTMQWTNKSSF